MKSTGHYSRVEDDYDLEHEINHNVDELKKQIEKIDFKTYPQKVKVVKAMIETLLDEV